MNFSNNNDNVAAVGNMLQSFNIKTQSNVKKKRHAYHNLDTSYPTGSDPSNQPPASYIPNAPQTAKSAQISQSDLSNHSNAIGINARDNNTGTGRYAGGSNTNDPMSAIPSLTQDRDYAQASLGQIPLFKTFESACPPPACCEYEIQDQGISGPNFARLTMYNIPATEQLRASTKLPLGMLVRPFAPPLLGPQTIPVVDFTAGEPPRCRRCRAYMNPFMLFVDGGTKFVCNMCQFSNPVPTDYFQPTDHQNRRIDCHERPELSFGTYDLAVSKDYWHESKPPVPTRYLFAIDVSSSAIKKQLHMLAIQAITDTLYGGNFPSNATVAIVTFDQDVQFYNLNSILEQFQMLVMTDKTDPFVPIEEGLFVNPEKSKPVIEQLLNSIQEIFGQNRSAEPCYGTVLEVIYKALKDTGGKASITLSSVPTRGSGNLYMRSNQSNTNVGSVDTELLRAASHFFTENGKKYAQSGIGLDIYAFASSFLDLANIGEVSRASGGHVHYFPSFTYQADGSKFITEFIKSNTIELGTQCMLKVRCSNGLQVSSYLGNLYTHENHPDDDPFFGTMDSYDTIAVLFKHDGKLDTKLDAHFQAALLYTSAEGQRRVRVINVLASVTEQFKPVMSYVDVDSCIGVISREALSHMGRKPCKEIKVGINEKLIEAFAAYRRHAGSTMPSSQLLMPVALRSFLIYGLSLLKSDSLKEKPDNTDTMVSSHLLINSLSADEMALYLYPRIIGLHNLRPDDCLTVKHQIENQHDTIDMFQMPVNINATATSIADGGVYLMYNGQRLILFIHKLVNPNLIKDLFGSELSRLEDIDPYLTILPEIDTEISRQSRALVDYFIKQSGNAFLPIKIARQGLDAVEQDFYAHLVEDRSAGTYSYSDYVAHVHRSVKQVMENGNVKSTTHLLNETVSLSHLGL